MKWSPLLVCALAVSSCTLVDLGGAVDNVGRQVPVSFERAVWFKKHPRTIYPLYTTQDCKRYIELRAFYLPARAKWFNCFMVGGCPVEAHERFEASLYYGQPQTYYAEITGNSPYTVTRLVPAADFPTTDVCVSKIEFTEHEAQNALRAHLPDCRNALNTAVQPIRWVAEVADIPLSLVATPINWLVLPTGYSLWKL
ncbi:MAG: hypothetical protein E7031_06810 [Akkermansiaceae bacterium]|nr:hypothetical protein [Akkermansiaceae bacterium]